MRFLLPLLLLSSLCFAQSPCEFSTNVTDSLGTLKTTKDFIFYERNFGGSQTYIFFALQENNGIPSLNLKLITKGKGFVKASCFDKNSRVFLQLDNGKIVTLIHSEEDSCGNSLSENGTTTRLNNGYFLFVKGGVEDLKASPVSFMRIRYSTETVDYPIKSTIVSELTKETYEPQTYFQRYLKCIFG